MDLRFRDATPVCLRGLRITVWDVLDMLASGLTEDEILQEYPYLEKDDFPAVYACANLSPKLVGRLAQLS